MRTAMREDGFTLVELLFSTVITLMVLATAMSTFQSALTLNETATLVSDSNQNLRAGTNTLARDLMQTGRGIPTGGIPIPSGAGAQPINRPSPPGQAYQFNNVTATTLQAITTGSALGPTVDGEVTDIVTLLATDMTSYATLGANPPAVLQLNNNPLPAGMVAPGPQLAADGASLNVGAQFATWITDPVTGVKPGNLLLFSNGQGDAIQTVTRVTGTQVFFESNAADWFNFNQRGAPAGSIMQIRAGATFSQTSVVRVTMLTYYVDATTTPGVPRLVRQENNFSAQTLAGVVEDLELSYDLVDGVTNPTAIPSLPFTTGTPAVTYTASQIRKANVHVGVRSELFSTLRRDYLRQHLTTGVSIRSLAYVDRYK